ncbi:pentatricopeptide repeat-containing protein At2g02750 [Amborella trichopoda]|uniref:Pentacotripeptide-repeat region of PRORP domain-containing protein n=1 Tax=Amborella trichopoda TaxID=13333 RepID=W1P7C3_AMBTC|nr:pentatricopeptide repeat-containing protein At2g02750 [Amborella trichopoda]ERN03818.1 hypothetical protein AMTR_s00078p00125150 [Amborella trichopoda]|eukprot:XP_006842143.3 pentatricopeptide repeat-containing protein At2g02750 [Amborella trichopoda]
MRLNNTDDAVHLLDEIEERNLPSFNAAISGFSRNGLLEHSIAIFRQALIEGIRPNSVSVAGLLPACSKLHGKLIHGFSLKSGLNYDIFVSTATLTMYATNSDLGSAEKVFGLILERERNVVCYNAMIATYLQNGDFDRVIKLFREMREKPNSVTFMTVLSACAGALALQYGREIHSLSLKFEGGNSVLTGTALIDMYSKCGFINQAQAVFNTMSERNTVTWNSLISGLILNGHHEEAMDTFSLMKTQGIRLDSSTWLVLIGGFSRQKLGQEALDLFREMLAKGVKPCLKSITSLLQACSSLSNLSHGREIHGYTVRSGLDSDHFLLTALVDMYSKCGSMDRAQRAFNEAQWAHDPAPYNAMIGGYGKNGQLDMALNIYNQMIEDDIKPNSATITSVLSVFNHAGVVDQGWRFFEEVRREYHEDLTIDHYACMADLLGRAGRLVEARELIRGMPMKPLNSMFASLLGACSLHCNVEIGEEMADILFELEPENPAPVVVLSNIYANLGRWGSAENAREMMRERGLKKVPGRSWIGLNC